MNIEQVRLPDDFTFSVPDLKGVADSTIVTSDALAVPGPRTATAPAAGSLNFVDNGGPVLTNVSLQVIFCGSAWQAGTTKPSAQDVLTAVQNILSGPYMSALSQYRNIGQGKVSRAIGVATDPPNPFSVDNVVSEITGLINNQALPPPSSDKQLLYCMFMPPGVSSNVNIPGSHGYFTYTDGSRVHYAWLLNNGTLQYISELFSYHLIGSCTDPEGNGIVGAPGTCSQQGWCEIETVCQQPATVNGVNVWTYWSQQNQACVAPGS
jgi:hypothetical protein